MTSRERVFAMIAGKRTDRLPVMPITMMLAADQIGAKYRRYVTDHRVLVEAQMRTAERFDLDYVSSISDRPARPPTWGPPSSSSRTSPPPSTRAGPSWPRRRPWRASRCPTP